MHRLSARPLADGEVLDIGGAALRRRLVAIPTTHVPHNWESHMLFEKYSGTLLLGDLCTQLGDGPAVTVVPVRVPRLSGPEVHRWSYGADEPQD